MWICCGAFSYAFDGIQSFCELLALAKKVSKGQWDAKKDWKVLTLKGFTFMKSAFFATSYFGARFGKVSQNTAQLVAIGGRLFNLTQNQVVAIYKWEVITQDVNSKQYTYSMIAKDVLDVVTISATLAMDGVLISTEFGVSVCFLPQVKLALLTGALASHFISGAAMPLFPKQP